MRFHIITLFPESFESYMNASIIGRAIENKKIQVQLYHIREYTKDKHRRTDFKPYGGGPGMVMFAEPIVRAVAKATRGKNRKYKVIVTMAGGKEFTNTYAKKNVEAYTDIIIICGRYEGIDSRVKKILKKEGYVVDEVSIGNYVLTGGELPAMVMMDAMARQIPGVLGKNESIEETREASSEVYTRPEVLEYKKNKYRVPKVLLSGHHADIEEWRGKKNKKKK